MAEDICIHGVKIIQNKGIDLENVINYKTAKSTTGKTVFKSVGNSSEGIKFKSILVPEQYDIYEPIYFNLAELTKSQLVSIIVGSKSFMGRVESLKPNYDLLHKREYDWILTEDDNFVAEEKEFNTFNYSPSSVTAKSSTTKKVNAPLYITSLLNCNPVKNCGKFKVKCVYHLQDMLRYFKRYLNYNYDGQFCKYTEQELLKWQIYDAKLAKKDCTGKWNTPSKNFLKKKLGITTNTTVATNLTGGTTLSKANINKVVFSNPNQFKLG